MTAPNGSKTYVTTTELSDKLASIRWELRCYMLAIVLGVIYKFQSPAASTALRFASAINPF